MRSCARYWMNGCSGLEKRKEKRGKLSIGIRHELPKLPDQGNLAFDEMRHCLRDVDVVEAHTNAGQSAGETTGVNDGKQPEQDSGQPCHNARDDLGSDGVD